MTAATSPLVLHTSHPEIRSDASPLPKETSTPNPLLAPPLGGAPCITRFTPPEQLCMHSCRQGSHRPSPARSGQRESRWNVRSAYGRRSLLWSRKNGHPVKHPEHILHRHWD
jgi:hypothetical protein